MDKLLLIFYIRKTIASKHHALILFVESSAFDTETDNRKSTGTVILPPALTQIEESR